jgi:hypothetical protein
MLYRKIIAVCSESYKNQRHAELPNVKAGGIHKLGLKGLISAIYVWRHEKVSPRTVQWVKGIILRAIWTKWLQR